MKLLVLFSVFIAMIACNKSQSEVKIFNKPMETSSKVVDTITLGAGCFWCVEAVFQRLEGVHSVQSGYSNGNTGKPTYKDVCSGTTGYAEVCQITYNPEKLRFEDILEVFFKTHDPTTLNKQGADVGTQYRSGIYYHNDTQRQIAERILKQIDQDRIYSNPIVTEIKAVANYYPAEDYHQNYYNQNSNQSYCSFVITPKLEKFEKIFKSKIKPSN
jgi:peptide-methionine (S)-S-oxide reductase